MFVQHFFIEIMHCNIKRTYFRPVILDFFGIVLIGWFVTRLPKIIDGIKALINRVQKLITLLTGFIGSISNFLIDFGTFVESRSVFGTIPDNF